MKNLRSLWQCLPWSTMGIEWYEIGLGRGIKWYEFFSGQYQYALNITSMLLIVPVLPIAYWYLTEHTGPKYKLGEYKIMTWP